MTFAAKRLTTDAKIVLRNAGYDCAEIGKRGGRGKAYYIYVTRGKSVAGRLDICSGCVDNTEVEKLVSAAKAAGAP